MTGVRVLQFLALVLLALMLVASGAHPFTLPNKIGPPAEQYFVVQPNWEHLRAQWEYSHAANALVMFAGFCFVALAVLARE